MTPSYALAGAHEHADRGFGKGAKTVESLHDGSGREAKVFFYYGSRASIVQGWTRHFSVMVGLSVSRLLCDNVGLATVPHKQC